MLTAFLLTLRETLEAALIIGLVLSTLRATRRTENEKFVWLGSATGVILSAGIAVILNRLGAGLEGAIEEAFEGLTMLLAALVLTWMIFWMQKQSNHQHQNFKEDILDAGRERRSFPLFSLAFLAVFREGVELSLFLTAASYTAEWSSILVGALIGFILAISFGWALFKGLLRLNLKSFFNISSILLIIVAGGLIAHGIHELNEVGWIPSIIDNVWDLNPWFNEKTILGQLSTSLFGYNANPSLSEVLATLAYYGVVVLYLSRQSRPSKNSKTFSNDMS